MPRSSAKDKVSRTKVAIKRISPMSANEVVAKQALREIRLMRHLGRHSNVRVRVHDAAAAYGPGADVSCCCIGCRW